MSEAFSISIEFTFDPVTMLFSGRLPSGATFSFSPANVTGKLGANLDLLKNFMLREKEGLAPMPHVSHAQALDPEIQAFLDKGGVIQQVGVVKTPPKRATPITLEELGL